jgi:hypothetical protein
VARGGTRIEYENTQQGCTEVTTSYRQASRSHPRFETMPSSPSNIDKTTAGKQKYTLLSAVGPDKIIPTLKPKSQVPVSRSIMSSGSGSSATNLQMNSKQAKSKNPASLPVTCHLHHDLDGWSYTHSKLTMPSWPVLCSKPDCQEVRCRETPKDSYHWDLDWEAVDRSLM